mgnify:CR=1 FL=1
MISEDTKSEARQIKSLDQLQDWSKWMVGVEAITLGFTSTAEKIYQQSAYTWVVVFSVLTILLAAWVLSSIPSVTRRVQDGADLTKYTLYDLKYLRKLKITLNAVATAQHIAFFMTVLAVGYALISMVPFPSA